MNYFGKIISNISQAYSEINPATLTGAIDVIVVEQEDGTFLCSPFHVRFGKIGVLRSKEKIVDIEINGSPVDIHMKLGDSGEAFFLQECDDDEELTEELTKSTDSISESDQPASPLMDGDQTSTPKSTPANNKECSQNGSCGNQTKSDSVILSGAHDKSQKRQRRKKKSKQSKQCNSQSEHPSLVSPASDVAEEAVESTLNTYNDNEFHPFSDSEISIIPAKHKKDSFSDSFDCKSDSEYEMYKANVDSEKCQGQDNISWGWGELPNVKKDSTVSHKSAEEPAEAKLPANVSPRSSVLGGVLNFMIKDPATSTQDKEEDKGIYLDDLDPNDMNPEVAAKYFTKFRSGSGYSSSGKPTIQSSSDDDVESGNGPSLSNSPHSSDFNFAQHDFAEFEKKAITGYDLLTINKVYHDLSMSLCGKIEDLTSSPNDSESFLQSIISFDDFSENPLSIIENPNLVIRMGGKYFTWKMASSIILSLLMFQRPLPEKTLQQLKDKCIPKKNLNQNSKSSWRSWFRGSNPADAIPNNQSNSSQENSGNAQSATADGSNFDSNSFSSENYSRAPLNKSDTLEYVSDDETLNILLSNGHTRQHKNDGDKRVKYRKVLRLTSDILKNLNLKPDCNEVMFSVTTAYQGTTVCKSKIFLWRYDDKVVISDIDGTITKSDVLGHILPYIGKDWAQMGVTKLYTSIWNNGYKFLYLSARAIGQARATRDYLGALCQEEFNLPDGPVLLSPTSLFSALHREVIEKKPEEFKISCLKDIQSLFPTNPFFCGFGNKINDTWAYKAVGIDSSRIFTINHKGELKLDKIMSFRSTYSDLSLFVDQMFPPLDHNDTEQNNYSSFMYWRPTIPDIEDIDQSSSPPPASVTTDDDQPQPPTPPAKQ